MILRIILILKLNQILYQDKLRKEIKNSNEYKLSDKYLDFLKHRAPVEALDGTTSVGKTTVGILKFMLMVVESPKKMHVILLIKELSYIRIKLFALRDKSTELIFSNFERKNNVISKEKVNRMKFIEFTVRLYTAYS